MIKEIRCFEGSIGLKEHILIRTLTFNFFTSYPLEPELHQE